MIEIIVVFVLAIALRLLPFQIIKSEIGVDHWFWKTYAAEIRKQGSFPPVIEKYLLDDYQWYPPLYGWILCLLDPKRLDKVSRYLSVFLDLARMLLLTIFTLWFTENNTTITAAALLIYAS